jgi:hypothetical protein
MVDTYTKAVLTVIALALTVMVLRPMFEPRQATAMAVGCGGVIDPCYVVTVSNRPLRVIGHNQ